LPLIEAVRILGEAKNRTLRTAMFQIEEGLRGGERLSDCLDCHEGVPGYYRGIMRSAD
jgi:type IV pilus assembly protein PilC